MRTTRPIPEAAADVGTDVWDVADEALLAGMAAGDRTAAAAFVRRFQRRVFGLALGVVHDEGVAAEVAQDAFVRAWRSAASFDARRGSVSTWLLAIARHTAIDRVRMAASRPADPVDPAALVRPSPAPGPDEVATTRSEIDRVLHALDALPPAQRRCVVLATIGGRTAREISEADGVALGTVKGRIRDGLLRLRTLLAESEASHG